MASDGERLGALIKKVGRSLSSARKNGNINISLDFKREEVLIFTVI